MDLARTILIGIAHVARQWRALRATNARQCRGAHAVYSYAPQPHSCNKRQVQRGGMITCASMLMVHESSVRSAYYHSVHHIHGVARLVERPCGHDGKRDVDGRAVQAHSRGQRTSMSWRCEIGTSHGVSTQLSSGGWAGMDGSPPLPILFQGISPARSGQYSRVQKL
eukprot:scaffold242833_cov34-Tisochrysis_lutea.AAC.2